MQAKMIWNRENLRETVESKLGAHKFIVVSNREPYVHVRSKDELKCVVPPSGVVVALDPVMRSSGGTWVAHGSGNADRDVVDSHDRVQVPPQNPSYTLRRVWLTTREFNAYYYGFANEGLWPLCHIAYVRPTFKQKDWNVYRRVNEKFAKVVLEEMGNDTGVVFIQDYHFALLARMIKEARPDIFVVQFWHIPWPNSEAFRVCPYGEEILNGLLANDVLGFHIRYHCQNFVDTVDRTLEAKVNRERFSLIRDGKETLVRPFPIGIDFEKMESNSKRPEVETDMRRVRDKYRLEGKLIGVGIERIDYMKGIAERFVAVDRLFEKYPEYVGRFTFIQLGPRSRIYVRRYNEYNHEIDRLVSDINKKHRKKNWRPIILEKRHLPQEELATYYRLADVLVVSSLHDGMNLVAKEYVASRWDLNGVLVLSRFTGAARELETALLINPYSTEQLADAIKQALEMSPDEKAKRMKRMRAAAKRNNVYRWAGKIVNQLKGHM